MSGRYAIQKPTAVGWTSIESHATYHKAVLFCPKGYRVLDTHDDVVYAYRGPNGQFLAWRDDSQPEETTT